MNNAQTIARLSRMRQEILTYHKELHKHVGPIGLRFIDNNFRAQGWLNKTLIPWQKVMKMKPGQRWILMNRGTLRRGFHSDSPGLGKARWYNEVKYARVHNEGFRGTVNVPAHSRRVMQRQRLYDIHSHQGRRQPVQVGEIPVKAHTMKMNIPRRQFMPTTNSPSETFNKQIYTRIDTDMKKILGIH